MTFTAYWQILRGRMAIVIAALVILVSITGGLLIIEPKTYSASTTLNFDFNGSNPYAGTISGTSAEASYISTQVSIISSIKLAEKVYVLLDSTDREKVANALEAKKTILDRGLASVKAYFVTSTDNPRLETQTRATEGDSQYHWIVSALPGDLMVTPIIGSQILKIAYTATDPAIAALLTNVYAQAYVQTTLEMIVNPAQRTKSWIDKQAKFLRAHVEKAQAKLIQYQQQQGIIATDERLESENQRLMDLSRELSQVGEEYRSELSKQQQVKSLLAQGRIVDDVPAIAENTVVRAIKGEIRQLEAKLAELSGKLGINHPRLQSTRAELTAAKVRMKREIDSIVKGFSNSVAAIKERERTVQAALIGQKKLVLQFKGQRGEAEVLQREVESARDAYNTVLKQLTTTNLQSVVTQTNVQILDQAQQPRAASGPKYAQNLILAVIVGLMLGVGLVFVMEMLDRRIRTSYDLSDELDLPVLGVLQRA